MPMTAARHQLPPLPFKPNEFGLPIVTSIDSYRGPSFATTDQRYRLSIKLTDVLDSDHPRRFTLMECDAAGQCITVLCSTDDDAELMTFLSGPFRALIARRPPISFEFNGAQIFNPFFCEDGIAAVLPTHYGFSAATDAAPPTRPLPDGSQILLTNADGTGLPVSCMETWLRLRAPDGMELDAHLVPSPEQIAVFKGVAPDRRIISHFHVSAFSGAQWWDRLFDFERQAYRTMVAQDITDQLRIRPAASVRSPVVPVSAKTPPCWQFLDQRLLALDSASRPGNAIVALLNDIDALIARHPELPPEEALSLRSAAARTASGWFHCSLMSPTTAVPALPPASCA